MKINPSRKLIPEDFPAESREIIKRIGQIINPFLDQVTAALSNAVTIRENLKAQVIGIDLDSGISTAILPWGLNEKPTAVIVGQLTKGNQELVAQNYSLAWLFVDGKINITFYGLAATNHRATIVALV